MNNNRVVLITGASSGFGKAIAEYLSSKGFIVYGTSRNPEITNTPYEMLKLDVTDDRSVKSCIAELVSREGHIDVLINNAGIAIAGSAEDLLIEEFRLQMETSFMGVVRMCREVLPHMRLKNRGLIINIGSIAGIVAVPFHSAYSSAKFALEGYTEAMRIELKPYGIKTVLLEPGDYNTGITDRRIKSVNTGRESEYSDSFESALLAMEESERKGNDPVEIARLISKIIDKDSPGLRYTAGPFVQRLAVYIKRVIPHNLFEYIVRKTYKL